MMLDDINATHQQMSSKMRTCLLTLRKRHGSRALDFGVFTVLEVAQGLMERAAAWTNRQESWPTGERRMIATGGSASRRTGWESSFRRLMACGTRLFAGARKPPPWRISREFEREESSNSSLRPNVSLRHQPSPDVASRSPPYRATVAPGSPRRVAGDEHARAALTTAQPVERIAGKVREKHTPNTERTYVMWAKKFVLWVAGAIRGTWHREVTAYLNHPAVEREVSVSTPEPGRSSALRGGVLAICR